MFPFLIEDYELLNPEQKTVVDRLTDAVHDFRRNLRNEDRMFFVSGVAGTGKTHTYKYLYDSLTAKGYKVVCMAFTGVAAALLPNGKTLHSALGLPVPLTRDSESRLQPFMQQ
jgi:type II secretory pathway predicted ATPase ExeA